jgi:glucose-6-phosphate dehydrogenase assembly protein OpcA
VATLQRRATDFVPGDTDLAWTRCTPWRTLLASALDGVEGSAVNASVAAESGSPSASLLAGWLSGRLGIDAELTASDGPGITDAGIVVRRPDGETCDIRIDRPDGMSATLVRGGEDPRTLPLPRRDLGDLLAEELRRMDPDPVYAEALARCTSTQIDESPRSRVLVWRDPALAT